VGWASPILSHYAIGTLNPGPVISNVLPLTPLPRKQAHYFELPKQFPRIYAMTQLHKIVLVAALLAVVSVSVLVVRNREREYTHKMSAWNPTTYVPNVIPLRERRTQELFQQYFDTSTEEPIRNEVVFLACGHRQGWIAPPSTLVQQYAELKNVTVRSVSNAMFTNKFRVVSRTDGRAGHVRYIEVTEWLSDDCIRVDTGIYGGPLYGGSEEGAIYRYTESGWEHETSGRKTIS
jgi:hypothetical protein